MWLKKCPNASRLRCITKKSWQALGFVDIQVANVEFRARPTRNEASRLGVLTVYSFIYGGMTAALRCIVQGNSRHTRRSVYIRGISDNQTCGSDASLRDSWIFLLSVVDNAASSFRLNSSLIRITLTNIDRIEALVGAQSTTLMRCKQLSIYNNRIVAMATGRGLRGWTDGRVRQAQAASGELWAGIEGSRGGGGMAYDDGRTGARFQARLGRLTIDGLADGSNRAKIARAILARIY